MLPKKIRGLTLMALAVIAAAETAMATPITITGKIDNGANGSAFHWYNPAGSPTVKYGLNLYPNSTFSMTIDSETGDVDTVSAKLFSNFMVDGRLDAPAFDINTVISSIADHTADGHGIVETEGGWRAYGAAEGTGIWYSQNTERYGVPLLPGYVPLRESPNAQGVFASFRLLDGIFTDYEALLGKEFVFNSLFKYGGTGSLTVHVIGTITGISGLGSGPDVPTSVPEPTSMMLLGVGLAAGAAGRRRRASSHERAQV